MTAPTPGRVRPDGDLFLAELLRAALPGVTVVNLIDTEALKRLPLVAVRVVSPGSFDQTRNVRMRYPIGVDVEAWAEERRAASDLDDRVLGAFLRAQELGTKAGGAYASRFAIDSPGAELRTASQPGRLHRWSASYSFTLRPAS